MIIKNQTATVWYSEKWDEIVLVSDGYIMYSFESKDVKDGITSMGVLKREQFELIGEF